MKLCSFDFHYQESVRCKLPRNDSRKFSDNDKEGGAGLYKNAKRMLKLPLVGRSPAKTETRRQYRYNGTSNFRLAHANNKLCKA